MGDQVNSEREVSSRAPIKNGYDVDMSMVMRENRDLKEDMAHLGDKEQTLLQKLDDLKKQNLDLRNVMTPMKKEKNKFYDKYFDQEQKIEIFENKIKSLFEDNENLKKLLENKNTGI